MCSEPVRDLNESRHTEPIRSSRYFGDVRARDVAYHQGTVWPWLIRPFVDAWTLVYPDKLDELQPVALSLGTHVIRACVGSISEIFDAEPPYTPRGCCAQAVERRRGAAIIDSDHRFGAH